eukprot:m.772747 g.772747  ORF g.772747 m.772747 type:complete len:567 (-) comp23248_c0_seq31:2145-3845(-)
MTSLQVCRATSAFAPRNVDELAFDIGDIITVIESPEGGWWKGSRAANGSSITSGWFPANHVEPFRQGDANTGSNKDVPYADLANLGYPRLGLYEDLPGDSGASDGHYEIIGADIDNEDIGDKSLLTTPQSKHSGVQKSKKTNRGGAQWQPLSRADMHLDDDTTSASWFLPGMPREQIRWWVKQLLDLGPVGGYIVREPDSQADAYALVVKTTPTKTKNYLIKCEVLDGVQTVRLGAVRSRSLKRLCEKLAIADSPLVIKLLPGFFLNKKAAIKKAMKDGTAVPGLLPEEFEFRTQGTPKPKSDNQVKWEARNAATAKQQQQQQHDSSRANHPVTPKAHTGSVGRASPSVAHPSALNTSTSSPAVTAAVPETRAKPSITTPAGAATPMWTCPPAPPPHAAPKSIPPPLQLQAPLLRPAPPSPSKLAGTTPPPSTTGKKAPPAVAPRRDGNAPGIAMRDPKGRPLSPTSALLASIGDVNSMLVADTEPDNDATLNEVGHICVLARGDRVWDGVYDVLFDAVCDAMCDIYDAVMRCVIPCVMHFADTSTSNDAHYVATNVFNAYPSGKD